MATKSVYKTKQREELSEYLRMRPNVHITVNDICEHFKSQGKPIGVATVYRHLERMVDEGLITKYILDANTPACFEYTASKHHSKENCFHCKCEKCGKLIHLHCDELSGIKNHLSAHHGFALNSMRTVFYGLCAECSDKEQNIL